MTKKLTPLTVFLMMFLVGCGKIGDKSGNLSSIYAVAAGLSLLLLALYCSLIRKKDPWYILLFASFLVVNIGYFSLATSSTLEAALLANRIAYMGSVFLPFFMVMILLQVSNIGCKKWIVGLLIFLGVFVFLVAASPGYLDIYYQEVTLQSSNGITVLNKVYGPWHSLYLFYLVGYFSAMLALLFYAGLKKKLQSRSRAVMIILAVAVNLLVWLAEQLIKIEFEFLSVSYIISGAFLLGLCMITQEEAAQLAPVSVQETTAPDPVRKEVFTQGLAELTATERKLYHMYLDGLTTQQILEELNIKENTLKYHNRNLYSKLGVSSRKELRQIARND